MLPDPVWPVTSEDDRFVCPKMPGHPVVFARTCLRRAVKKIRGTEEPAMPPCSPKCPVYLEVKAGCLHGP